MVRVVTLGPEDWERLRQIRLRSLSQDPDAFGSTLQREAGFDRQTWESRLRTGQWFLALCGQEPCGVVAGITLDAPDERHLVSLWVAPEQRGEAIGAQLAQPVIDWARRDGARRLLLWVMEDNLKAIRLYERLAFRPTGRSQALPRDHRRRETEMALDL